VNWIFATRSDIVVVGHNAENADITNPTGAIHGLLWLVQARNDHGDTRELAVLSKGDTEAAAERLAAALNVRMAAGKLPVAFDMWPAGRAVYGSDAYVEYGQADEVALEARELEEERWN
jgi:hypothetical protein